MQTAKTKKMAHRVTGPLHLKIIRLIYLKNLFDFSNFLKKKLQKHMMGPVKQFDIYAEFKTFIYPSEYKVTLHMEKR